MKKLSFFLTSSAICIIILTSFRLNRRNSNTFWYAGLNHGRGLGYALLPLVDEALAYNPAPLLGQPATGNSEFECNNPSSQYVCAALFSTTLGVPLNFAGAYITGEYHY